MVPIWIVHLVDHYFVVNDSPEMSINVMYFRQEDSIRLYLDVNKLRSLLRLSLSSNAAEINLDNSFAFKHRNVPSSRPRSISSSLITMKCPTASSFPNSTAFLDAISDSPSAPVSSVRKTSVELLTASINK